MTKTKPRLKNKQKNLCTTSEDAQRFQYIYCKFQDKGENKHLGV